MPVPVGDSMKNDPEAGWRAARVFSLLALALLSSLPGGAPQASPSAPLVGAGTPLPILSGATWAYFKGTVEPPATWNTIAFNDASWLTGPSGFGYGDSDDATVLTDMQNGYLSVYTRRQFDVPNPATIAGLELRVNWDDGFVAFINGQEVARRNLAGTAGTPVAHDIAASSHEGGAFETIAVSSSMLVAGTNVIAVQGHNRALDSTDLTLNVELRATNPPPNAPTGPSPANGATGVSINPNLCVTVSDPNDTSLSVTFHGRPVTGTPPAPFTIIALPDTQYYSESFPATYTAQTQWILDNRISRNIAFITQLGDCVNVASTIQQWINADAAWDIVEDPQTTGLEDGMPYGIAVGNHDQTPAGDPGTFAAEGSTTANYNTYFGISRFTGRDYYGNHYGNNNDNHYELFEASGMEFIAIHMEYMPSDTPLRQAVLNWADGVLQAFPTRRAILTAHYFLNPSDASWSNQGQATWDALKDNHNIFLMLSGHLDQANNRYEEFTDATGTTKVNALVSDYQTLQNGGNGWLRILTFHPDTDTINVETYSPTLGVFIDNHANNTAGTARNRLTLTYDMAGGAPFVQTGSSSGANNTQVCAPWPGRQGLTTYEWYAVVSDGVSSVTGARQTFTTGPATCSVPADCADGNPCTTEACVSNVCQYTPVQGCCQTAPDCNDNNACTTDACNAGTCEYTNNTLTCDDGNGCTVGDVCAGGVCGGTPNTCDDGNACTTDSCVSGACVNAYNPTPGCCTNSDDCDDGALCSADSCQGGTCVNLANANCCDTDDQCDDGESCTADVCSPTNTASVTFNGTSSYVSMGVAPGLGSAQFTIETWFMRTGTGDPNQTGTSGIPNFVPLVTKGAPESDASNIDANYVLGIDDDLDVIAADFEQFGTCTGGTGTCAAPPFGPGCNCTVNADCQSGTCSNAGLNHPVYGSTPISEGVWYHAAATYDGTTWRLYLNGNIDKTQPVGAVSPRFDSVQPFALGTMHRSAQAPLQVGFFAGSLDEVRVWNVVRTDGEIQSSMNAQILSAAGLVGRWGLDEGTAGTAGDSTTNPVHEDGTLAGGASWGTGVPAISSGTCTHDPIDECCHSNTDCDDGNSCTTDACEGATCEHVATPGCCVTAADCADGNPCTSEACVNGTCDVNPVPNCCTTDAQCNDGIACTTDFCPTSGNVAAITLDGSNDYVTMGEAAGTSELGATNFTVEAWINWAGGGLSLGTGTGGISSAIPILSKGGPQAETPANVNMNYFLGIANGRLAADFEDAATGLNHPVCTQASQPTIPTNTWHHTAATYDGTSWKLYLDGVELPIDTACSTCTGAACTVSPGATPESGSIQHFAVGTSMTSTGGLAQSPGPGHFQGRIDEVRVWNVARTAAQIQAARNREVETDTNLIGRWDFDAGNGPTAADSSGRGNNGTLTNGPTWSTTNLTDLGAANVCEHEPLIGGGCCSTNADCNDGNPCTTDTCSSNTCTITPIPGCTSCTSDAQCNDNNTCTSESCNTANDAAADLRAAADYVNLGRDATTNLINNFGSGSFTVEGWFYADAAPASDLISIFRAGRQGAFPQVVLQLRNNSGTYMSASIEGQGGGAQVDTPNTAATVTLTQWHHFAMVVDRPGSQVRVYLNGNLGGSIALPAALTTLNMNSADDTMIGATRDSAGALINNFNGRVDEVRIWNVARTQAEIQADRTREVVASTGLVHRWGFNEASGNAIDDPGTFDGVMTGGATRITTTLPTFGNDLCVYAAVNDGATCDDANACTTGTTCSAGVCGGGSAVPPPGEAQNVRADNKTSYVWDATSGATLYDVVRGSLSALPVGPGGADEACFGDLPAATLVDGASPPLGSGYWYLTRAQSACGNGTYGNRSNGTPRTSTTCP